MDKNIIKEVILDQREYLLPGNLISRDIQTEIVPFVGSGQVIILSGIRRCGKSVLLRSIRREIENSDCYINFDDDRLCSFTLEDFQFLLEVFIELFGESDHFFFDEIQNVEGWERFVRRLHDMGKTVFVTGSNARMLSRELGTHLTGRYIRFELFPFSFAEFISFCGGEKICLQNLSTSVKATAARYFCEWVKYGGIPDYLTLKNKEYLHFLFESVLYRDIIVRHSVQKEREIKELAFFLASNIGKEVSFNSLRKMLGLGSAGTVSDYCSFFEDSYLFFFLKRYSASVKKQVQYNKKVYCVDSALQSAVGFRFSEDEGRILENIVFLKLRREGKDIFFHKEKHECDFVICDGNRVTAAFQVTKFLNPMNWDREVKGLCEALVSYGLKAGIILTESMEEKHTVVFNETELQINVLPVWKWINIDNNACR